MSDPMEARRAAAHELLELVGRMSKAASLIVRCSARLLDEGSLIGRGTGPLRKHVTSTDPKPGWSDEIVAIVDKLEGHDSGAALRTRMREKQRDGAARDLAQIAASNAGRLVRFGDFDRMRRDRDRQDGDQPPPGSA